MEQKWIEQFSEENLNWNNIYTSRLQATKDVWLQIPGQMLNANYPHQ